jgi:hypothetical protein
MNLLYTNNILPTLGIDELMLTSCYMQTHIFKKVLEPPMYNTLSRLLIFSIFSITRSCFQIVLVEHILEREGCFYYFITWQALPPAVQIGGQSCQAFIASSSFGGLYY